MKTPQVPALSGMAPLGLKAQNDDMDLLHAEALFLDADDFETPVAADPEKEARLSAEFSRRVWRMK